MDNRNKPYAYLHIPLQGSSQPFVTIADSPPITIARSYHLYAMSSSASGYVPPPAAPLASLPVPPPVAPNTSAQATFPYPTNDSQPRRHFTGGAGVGTFVDPIRGRQSTASIYEHSARVYPAVRHHHVRVTALQLVNRTVYRAALFLMDQPTRITFDVRTPAPPTADAADAAAVRKDESSVFENKSGEGDRSDGNEAEKGGEGGSQGVGKGQSKDIGQGEGEGIEAESSKNNVGNIGAEAESAGTNKDQGNKARRIEGSSIVMVADDEDSDSIPYSVGVPEFVQRLAVVGAPGDTVDEAIEGLEKAVVEELERTVVENMAEEEGVGSRGLAK